MICPKFKLLLLLCYGLCGTFGSRKKPIVTTPFGKIKGEHDVSFQGKTYSAFMGVPYAQPPIQDLRFREPQPHPGWSGTWEANVTSTCIQITHLPEPEGGELIGNEDCLHVNVFVPRKHPKEGENLNVIVHIHGGALNFGYGHFYGPKFLMDQDIVYVNFNYRLGPLGFLSTEDKVVPGNNGMKDQVAALRWIKENIKHFGGNPESIMITGLSAGGASVHFHYLSPLSKGLFASGISLSGTALCPWPLQEAALAKTRTLASAVGCRQVSTKELVECLRQRPARKLVESVRMFRPWLYNPFSPFGIVVEKNGDDNRFLTDHPYKLLKEGKVQDVPWLTSVTADEGLYPAADYVLKDHYLPHLEKHWTELAPYVLDYDYTVNPEDKKSVAEKIKKHYLKNKPISLASFGKLVQMMSDRLFVVDAEKAARLQAKANKSPVHFYYYSYLAEDMPTLAQLWTLSPKKWGISHGDEVPFLLNPPGLELKMSKRDAKVQKVLMDIWLSMAKKRVPAVEGVKWEPVSKAGGPLNYIHIKSPEKIVPEEAAELGQRSFWESLPIQENEHLLKKAKEEL